MNAGLRVAWRRARAALAAHPQQRGVAETSLVEPGNLSRRRHLRLLAALPLGATGLEAFAAEPNSDAPDSPVRRGGHAAAPVSYDEATRSWRSVADVNDWIGARFEYDVERAMKLSENQRAAGLRVRVYEPAEFYERPVGVCVDLARFAVEALRLAVPAAKPAYLMIEFDPAVMAGNTLRRHWVVQVEVDGKLYYFADSKRPGHVAGPYGTVQEYIDQYAHYRRRRIVAYRLTDSFERRLRQRAPKAIGEDRAG